ncbi:MAG: DNA metabolism protein [Pseudopedobacter saltans]|uniref:DNA metabolism protein n=1 Tax=Pseudopedobacter saltans TaxID=151895 RepID=A0A2W5F095_9SPHI|nr:MAG: DNA metabolism protein [Pseudopedobacter saltans]
MTYRYDGSFGGFLCSMFCSFERKEFPIQIVMQTQFAASIFEDSRPIETESEKAKRVFKGLEKAIGQNEAHSFFQVFLSEDSLAIQYAFNLLHSIFEGNKNILENYGDEQVLYFSQTLKKVSRERHRMKAFIRFQKSSDGLFFAVIAPDFNVLPLVISFFKKRYADQVWLIYDEKRNYGMMYNKIAVEEVQLTESDKNSLVHSSQSVQLDTTEEKYQQLWKAYFKSTNIVARKNIKLHLRHVPKRYWRYLTEKK